MERFGGSGYSFHVCFRFSLLYTQRAVEVLKLWRSEKQDIKGSCLVGLKPNCEPGDWGSLCVARCEFVVVRIGVCCLFPPVKPNSRLSKSLRQFN